MSNYDKHPQIDFTSIGYAINGTDEIREIIKKTKKKKIALELYPGVDKEEAKKIFLPLGFSTFIDTDSLKKKNSTLKAEFSEFITKDRVFGYMCPKKIEDCFDKQKLEEARKKAKDSESALIVGVGATLVYEDALIIYFDLSRWEIELRFRKGYPNWLIENKDESNLEKFKIGYFIEWRMADKLKMSIFDNIVYFVDSHNNKPVMVKGEYIRKALTLLPSRPFRMEPYFDPGVWGGNWMKEKFDLDKDKENYAWSFDGVPEENAINLLFKNGEIKLPAMDLVLYESERLLGSRVYGRYGSEFPIRFDLLDTMNGQNLSMQVHPLTSYIQNTFGMHYTQDESYYLLDAKDDACVFLGLKNDIDKGEMIEDLKKAQNGEKTFDAEKYVNKIKANKHDHFLIPAGTVHCSGKNSMVLEISSTPYIFTFKLWDWNRVGLDGKPRPIHIEHGQKNIQWKRNTDFVISNLVNNIKTIEETNDYRIEITGLDTREPIVTRRYIIQTEVTIETDDSVQMLNLVDGEECTISSPTSTFKPLTIHYAETFIVPADVKRYTIKAKRGPIMLIEGRIR